MPVIGCLEFFQNGRSPQPIKGIIYSPGCHELKIGSAAEDTLGFIPLVSYYPRVPIMGKGNSPNFKTESILSSWGPGE